MHTYTAAKTYADLTRIFYLHYIKFRDQALASLSLPSQTSPLNRNMFKLKVISEAIEQFIKYILGIFHFKYGNNIIHNIYILYINIKYL